MFRCILTLVVCMVPLGLHGAAPAQRARPTKLNFFWVATQGPMAADLVRNRLRVYSQVQLRGCKLPVVKRKELRGDVKVRAKISGTGRLQILEIVSSHDHGSLRNCLAKNIALWQMTNQEYDVGSLVSFKFYISFLKPGSGNTMAVPPPPEHGFRATDRPRSGAQESTPFPRRPRVPPPQPVQLSVVSGALPKKKVSKVVQRLGVQKDLRHCYRTAASRRPKQSIVGEMTLLMRVDRRGAVDRMEVLASSLNDADLQRCFLQLLVGKPFPEASGPTTFELRLRVP